jgi:hypothetical protein
MRPSSWRKVLIWCALALGNPASAADLLWETVPKQETVENSTTLVWELVPDGGEINVGAELVHSHQLSASTRNGFSPFRPTYYTPYIAGAQPSAYRLQWDEAFISGSAATPGNLRDGQVDASINLGLGLGNPDRLAAVEVNWNIGSVNNFNDNGSFDLEAGRVVTETPRWQFAAGGGLLSIYAYGTESGRDDANGYGVFTAATVLRPNDSHFPQLLQFSAGVGGNRFASINDQFESPDFGYFLALGMEITPQLGASIGRSGRGTNVVLSYLPSRDTPIYLDLIAANVFDENPYGTVGVLRLRMGGRQLYR